jgi:hypothetical protein
MVVKALPARADEQLGVALPTDRQLVQIVSAALGRPAVPASWSAAAVPYEAGSPATGALLRVHGSTTDGVAWSVFLKVLQHPRHWAGLASIPPFLRTEFVETFPWRSELDAWEPEFAAALPDGLRVPELYLLVELPQDRVAVWMEDIEVADEPWSLERFGRAADLLGRLAARRCSTDMLDSCPVPRGFAVRKYAEGPVFGALSALDNDELWRHSALNTEQGQRVRVELQRLGPLVPRILDMLDRCPQSLPHGDASPQNLLVPRAQPDTLVAIDIAFQCPVAIGFDLAQLLVGLAHAGEVRAADLPGVHRVLQPAFARGFADAGGRIDAADLSRGYLGSLIIRNAFTSIPYGELDRLPASAIAERLALTDVLCGLAADLPS